MFNECLVIRWKTAHFCNLNFSFKNHFVWEVISSDRHSVSSPDKTPGTSSKILRCALYFELSSRCFIWWWNTASHAWYITSKITPFCSTWTQFLSYFFAIIAIIIIYWQHSYHKSVPLNLQCLEILQCWPNSRRHWMK